MLYTELKLFSTTFSNSFDLPWIEGIANKLDNKDLELSILTEVVDVFLATTLLVVSNSFLVFNVYAICGIICDTAI